jgi:hypothetical protein
MQAQADLEEDPHGRQKNGENDSDEVKKHR